MPAIHISLGPKKFLDNFVDLLQEKNNNHMSIISAHILTYTQFNLNNTTVLPAESDSDFMQVLFTKLSWTYNRYITCVLILSTG